MGPAKPQLPPACRLTTWLLTTSTPPTRSSPLSPKSDVTRLKGVPVRSTFAKPASTGPMHDAAVAYGAKPRGENTPQLVMSCEALLTILYAPSTVNRSTPTVPSALMFTRMYLCMGQAEGRAEGGRQMVWRAARTRALLDKSTRAVPYEGRGSSLIVRDNVLVGERVPRWVLRALRRNVSVR